MRLIDADALIKEVNENKELYEKERVYLEALLLNAPTVDTFTFDDMKKGINVGYKAGRLSEKWERSQGKWIDYNNTFYKCPDCGYLLEKCCPQCQNKVILPIGGES